MIRSMTGFGSAEGTVGDSRVHVELRTVNHRFFNPSLKIPSAFARWETELRERLRLRITRGHVTLFARAEREATAAPAIDMDRFAHYVTQLRALQQRHALAGELDVATVLRMPDVVTTSRGEADAPPASPDELLAIVDVAIDALTAMRADEGARLAAFLSERVAVIERALSRIAERAPLRVVEQRDRLRAAVAELLDGASIDDARVAQEIAFLADRLDVSEELDRFSSHITAFRAALAPAVAEPVGKRLGFLVQEMLREANTTGSKANDAAMLSEVVTIKEELERIREQVENLE